jgi:hypothetical protein
VDELRELHGLAIIFGFLRTEIVYGGAVWATGDETEKLVELAFFY